MEFKLFVKRALTLLPDQVFVLHVLQDLFVEQAPDPRRCAVTDKLLKLLQALVILVLQDHSVKADRTLFVQQVPIHLVELPLVPNVPRGVIVWQEPLPQWLVKMDHSL